MAGDSTLVKPLMVRKCADFLVTGKGDHPEWTKAGWNSLQKLDAIGEAYESKFKILYSTKGIYVLLNGTDKKISTNFTKDFENLFEADVFEVFFHTDPTQPLYFEYEINQLNKELVLIIPNFKGGFYGWIPWHYEKERRTQKMVEVIGGVQQSESMIISWTAEIFFPYGLLKPLQRVPPAQGTKWNANFYRLDYDSGKAAKWAWSPVMGSFHQYEKFGQLVFE